jgi:hypothetical protein
MKEGKLPIKFLIEKMNTNESSSKDERKSEA